jgi:nitrite reductase/ring-hydroxylating ferredoxin subunit
MAESSGFPKSPTRRGVVAAAGGAGLAAALTACGSGSSSDDASSSGGSDAQTPSAGAGSGSAGASAAAPSASAGGAGGTPLGATSDIPVGGGKVFAAQKVVVTQPSAGQFKGFSAVCTHQGCTVGQVADGVIKCPCHGSEFHIADGSVAAGPATSALPAKAVAVSGGEVSLA